MSTLVIIDRYTKILEAFLTIIIIGVDIYNSFGHFCLAAPKG